MLGVSGNIIGGVHWLTTVDNTNGMQECDSTDDFGGDGFRYCCRDIFVVFLHIFEDTGTLIIIV